MLISAQPMLYLLIKPNGSRWRRLDYPYQQKRKTLSLGTYPVTSLADARKKADDLKKLVAGGVDPSETRKAARQADLEQKLEEDRQLKGLPAIDSFQFVADEWFNKKMQYMTEAYKICVCSKLVRDVYPTSDKTPASRKSSLSPPA